jgi:hypothetical protein
MKPAIKPEAMALAARENVQSSRQYALTSAKERDLAMANITISLMAN